MEQSPSSEANSHSASQEIPRLYRTPGLLPCSQRPSTGPYPKPDESSPQLSSLFP